MIALGLAVLALLDGCFAGFRAAAGRDGRTDKRAYARRACLQGTVAGGAVLAVLTAACLAALTTGTPYAAFVRAGEAMLLAFVPYAVVVLAALLGWVTLRPLSLQTLMSTLVLGPFTLVRPLVVAAGCLAGALRAHDEAVTSVVVLAGVLVLAVEEVLRRLPPPSVAPTRPAWAQPETTSR